MIFDGISKISVYIADKYNYTYICINTHDRKLFKKLALHREICPANPVENSRYYLDSVHRDLNEYSDDVIHGLFSDDLMLMSFLESGLKRTYENIDTCEWIKFVLQTLSVLCQFDNELKEVMDYLYSTQVTLRQECIKYLKHHSMFSFSQAEERYNLRALPIDVQALLHVKPEDERSQKASKP